MVAFTHYQPNRLDFRYRPAADPPHQGFRFTNRDTTMVFKLGLEAQKHWRRLNGPELVVRVVTGVKFGGGEESTQQGA